MLVKKADLLGIVLCMKILIKLKKKNFNLSIV